MGRTLIKCGWLVTMDPKLGEMENAELSLDGGEIAAIGHDLNATADDIIDADLDFKSFSGWLRYFFINY